MFPDVNIPTPIGFERGQNGAAGCGSCFGGEVTQDGLPGRGERMDNQLQAVWDPLSTGLFPTQKGDLHGKCLMMSCTVLNETKDHHEASQHKKLL